MDHLKILYWICYNIASVICFLGFWPRGMWDCSSPTGDRNCIPSIGRQSLNRWPAREAPYGLPLMGDLSGKNFPNSLGCGPGNLCWPLFTHFLQWILWHLALVLTCCGCEVVSRDGTGQSPLDFLLSAWDFVRLPRRDVASVRSRPIAINNLL